MIPSHIFLSLGHILAKIVDLSFIYLFVDTHIQFSVICQTSNRPKDQKLMSKNKKTSIFAFYSHASMHIN